MRACLETTRGAVFGEKAGWRDEGGAARGHHGATPKAFASRAKPHGLLPENRPLANIKTGSNSVGGKFHGEKAPDEICSWLTWTALAPKAFGAGCGWPAGRQARVPARECFRR